MEKLTRNVTNTNKRVGMSDGFVKDHDEVVHQYQHFQTADATRSPAKVTDQQYQNRRSKKMKIKESPGGQ